ncbi:MAG: hypothetical protein EHM72_10190 [Calditrichaeota bacterium]|nr:MAG: hypothetical protein EHM72_10190 [Calditrichota bacterium]
MVDAVKTCCFTIVRALPDFNGVGIVNIAAVVQQLFSCHQHKHFELDFISHWLPGQIAIKSVDFFVSA